MILKNLETTNDLILNEYDIDFHVVNSQSELSFNTIASSDAIIFRSDYVNYLKSQIQRIRRSDNPAVFLKPIFVSSKRTYLRLNKNLDGYIDDSELSSIQAHVNEMVGRINQLKDIEIPRNTTFQKKNFIKLTQFLFSRNMKLEAKRSRKAHMGFSYHFIDSLVIDVELYQFLDEIKVMSDKGFLTSELVEKVSLCKSCSSSYLHFAETCHRCKSIDIEAESLIHHFRCAYIGPESDFKRGDDLVCPKCDKMLRHIGVDYDKPSEIVHCNTCNHQSQQSAVIAKCVDCGFTNELSNLHQKSLYNFRLTEQGKNLALNPHSILVDLEEDKEKEIESELDAKLFELISNQESKKSYKKNLASFVIEVEFSPFVLDHLTATEISIFKLEFKKILINYLDEIDLFTVITPSFYKLLLVAKDQKYIDEMKLTLEYNINKILNDNFNDPLHELKITFKKL